MVLVITGSRSIRDAALVARAIEKAVTGPHGGYSAIEDVTELWHGGAKGVDRTAAAWAEARGITPRAFDVTPAEWAANKYLAGKRRNYRMVKAALDDPRFALVVGVWDWTSGGTSHAVACAVALGLPTFVWAGK